MLQNRLEAAARTKAYKEAVKQKKKAQEEANEKKTMERGIKLTWSTALTSPSTPTIG